MMTERKEPEQAILKGEAELANAIARARTGDAEAWGDLYRHYAPAIFRFCRRALPTYEDAEDATVEIFMKVREKLASYDPQRPFSSWLYKVAANHCWDMLRRRHTRQDLETGDVEQLPLPHPDPGQLAQLIEQQTASGLRVALAQLPPRARMILILRYYADLRYDEIAEALSLDPNAVGVALLRARQQLRRTLTQPDATPLPTPRIRSDRS
jgi:RNA polymerase sigma-70 factor (ECF subfamily)